MAMTNSDTLHIETTPMGFTAYYDPEGLHGDGAAIADALQDLLEQTDEAWRKALDEKDALRRSIAEEQSRAGDAVVQGLGLYAAIDAAYTLLTQPRPHMNEGIEVLRGALENATCADDYRKSVSYAELCLAAAQEAERLVSTRISYAEARPLMDKIRAALSKPFNGPATTGAASEAATPPFKCCGAGDPPCRTFEESCRNPANYDGDFGFCPKCKQPGFPFCATSGCPPFIQPPAPGSDYRSETPDERERRLEEQIHEQAREAPLGVYPQPEFGQFLRWGTACASCGKPVVPPLTIYDKPAQVAGNRIWHGRCFPAEGVTSAGGQP